MAEPIHCPVAGHDISLQLTHRVFKPTLTTAILTEQATSVDLAGLTALDLGCGSGPIAVALALCGARHVYAVDIMDEACELSRINALVNGVADRVTVLQGDLFEAVGDSLFDVIVDDVSGVAEDVARLSTWFPDQVPTGGVDGTSLTIRMLQQSREHLARGGRLYFPVLSLSSAGRIVDVAEQIYGDRLARVATKQIPFNPELKNNLPQLRELRDAGLIDFHQIRSRAFWTLDIYRATRD